MNDEIKIESVREAVRIFEEKLASALKTLEQQNMVSLERIRTLDQYKLAHPRGVLGLLYGGSNYESVTKGRTLIMKRTLLITVAPIIRFADNPIQPSENYRVMMPAEYVDFVVNNLSGITVFNHLSENERKVYPVRDELLKEEDYVWTYLVTMGVPLDFIERYL
jgi:hypothetical protein